MTRQNDGGPAFPCDPETMNRSDASPGLSIRDYFAATFIVGADDISSQMGEVFLGKKCPTWEPGNTMECVKWWADAEAKYRYLKADAMLKAREET